MSKRPTPTLKSSTFHLHEETYNKIGWLIHFSKELSVPNVSRRMVIARAIDFYIAHVEDLLTVFHCLPKDPDINGERKSLMEAGEGQVSVFRSADLPEPHRGTSGRLPSYSSMVKAVINPPKKPKLPSLKIPKHKIAAVEQILKEGAANGK